MSFNVNHSNQAQVDQMIIGSGHTIMASNVPSVVDATVLSENFYKWNKTSQESIEKLGLFGSDIDYNTYYPDLKAEDLKPQDSEFIEPMFRLLSETIVSKNWNPTDFGKDGVLKASMRLLLGQTVNCDHSTDIGNAIGSVSQVIWQESYKDGKFIVPAGINGVLKIDGKANPRIARGILMDPPSIHSNSVTVQFKWEKSHPELEDDEFYHKLGSYDKNGEMICRRVTEIIRYLETSLVSHGADSYAQKIGDDGKIINPEFANRTWNSFSEYSEATKKVYYFNDYKTDLISNKENDDTSLFNNNFNQPKIMPEELRKFLESLFGENMLSLQEGQELNAENALAAVQQLVSTNTNNVTLIEGLTNEKSTLEEKVTNLEAEVSNLKEMATVGTNHIATVRNLAVENYKKLKGEKADETIIKMLESPTTGLSMLESLNKEYTSQLEEKFPMKCSKCGSTDLSRASSQAEDTTHNVEEPVQVQSSSTVMEELYKAKI